MRDATDLELLQACVEGNRRAWAVFVERFTRYVWYLVNATGRRYGLELAEDALADLHNDVFVALLEDDRRRLRQYQGKNGASVRSWIRVITIRRTIDTLRKRRGGHLSLDVEEDEGPRAPTLVDTAPDALSALLDRETDARRDGLWALVEQLPEADQTLLRLLYDQRLPVPAACAALNIKRGALYTRKTRLIKRLRALAAEAGLIEASDGDPP
ncbi:MAG: sigma-70 family RNA polymerase sigma factor [Myxococcales bacterium]|nr:sigma-70 family RNA polymerase sigma factor [Myxococcales bacterium]